MQFHPGAICGRSDDIFPVNNFLANSFCEHHFHETIKKGALVLQAQSVMSQLCWKHGFGLCHLVGQSPSHNVAQRDA